MFDSTISEGPTNRKRKFDKETGPCITTKLCVGFLTCRYKQKMRRAMASYIQEHPDILNILIKGESTKVFLKLVNREIKASARKHSERLYVTSDYYSYYGASDRAEGTMSVSSLENRRQNARYAIRQQGKHGDDGNVEWSSFESCVEDNYYIVEGNKNNYFHWGTGAVERVEDSNEEEDEN